DSRWPEHRKGDGRGARQKAASSDAPELTELGEERRGIERRRSSGWLFGGGSPEVEEKGTREIWWWRPEAKGEMERFWVKGKVRGEGRENIGTANAGGFPVRMVEIGEGPREEFCGRS
ncbi:hypothetical protein HAX54_034677, partial [Datura stramonium]|nr:hypothetical protein [Datura stramonium]